MTAPLDVKKVSNFGLLFIYFQTKILDVITSVAVCELETLKNYLKNKGNVS